MPQKALHAVDPATEKIVAICDGKVYSLLDRLLLRQKNGRDYFPLGFAIVMVTNGDATQ